MAVYITESLLGCKGGKLKPKADMYDWNTTILNKLINVNHLLQEKDMPETAKNRLEDIQNCLCSGDGLCADSAFRAATQWLRDKIISLMGLEKSVTGPDEMGAVQLVPLRANPYGIREIYFRG